MGIYHVLNLVFYLEMFIVLLLILSILTVRYYSLIKNKGRTLQKERISQFVRDRLAKKEGKKVKKLPFLMLLETLESFNHTFKGEDWNTLKFEVAEKFLLPKARLLAKSLFWRKRHRASRVFAIVPLIKDEMLILQLLEDPKFLVKSFATAAALQIESQQGVYMTLRHMADIKGYSRFFYCDLLSQGTTKILSLVAKIASERGKEQMAALEVLANQTITFPLPFLEEALCSSHIEIHLAALKVLKRNPQKWAISHLLADIKHENPLLRALAAEGLHGVMSEEVISALKEALQDKEIKVRLSAAKALKAEGLLNKENGCDITDYVLTFD